MKIIEKYSVLTGMALPQVKLIAYQASKKPLSDYLERYLESYPNHT